MTAFVEFRASLVALIEAFIRGGMVKPVLPEGRED